jgi:NAD(P)-dependent dehydrogenase (short-subunit alcohol dehydrogenase family)
VNNAGVAMAGEIEFFPLDEYQRSFNINIMGPLRVTKSVLHMIRHSKGCLELLQLSTSVVGRVVTITSGIARSVMPGRSAYCMPKAAQEAMNDCLRLEMIKFGVQVCTYTQIKRLTNNLL